ncbi:bacillithiol biosynthesis cysteine-adding enzyme BshC [Paenibacillus yanchengensis]|uniref:Putative cysteine ligase BshC n=1 Tax=Paenibacillus yanchengensis TaxID=2035833 RepID=A0ABW4YL76_9BACL
MTIRYEQHPLSSAQRLSNDFIQQTNDQLQLLFPYHPSQEQDWKQRLESIQNKTKHQVDRSNLAAVLRTYNEKAGAGAATFSSIDSIASGSPVIIGGQQAGLWSGPLLVVYKVVSIIQSARYATELLGEKVVPVFWIAGEDHDWDEVNHTYILSAEQELKKVTLSRPPGANTSVSRSKVTVDQWAKQLTTLEEILPNTEFKEPLLALLQQYSEQSESLSDLFAKMMVSLFPEEGLIVIDADDPNLRHLESEMFQYFIEHNDALAASYHKDAEKVKQLGYPLQVEPQLGCSNLFYFAPELEGERVLLYKQDGLFVDRKQRIQLTKEQLLQIAEQQPELLSNNVLTRPLMQEFLFPVLGTVLGTGEIAYWAATGTAFAYAAFEQPIIIPRTSFTLLDGVVDKNMKKYELSFTDVIERFDECKAAWLKEQDTLQLEEQFSAVAESFTKSYTPLLQTAVSIQPGLAKLGDTNLNKILEQIRFMEQKTVAAHEKQFEAAIRQFDRIKVTITPADRLQERALTVVSYLSRYGQQWLEELLTIPYKPTGGHYIIYL